MINACLTRVALTSSIINESMFSVFFFNRCGFGKKKSCFYFLYHTLKKKKKKKNQSQFHVMDQVTKHRTNRNASLIKKKKVCGIHDPDLRFQQPIRNLQRSLTYPHLVYVTTSLLNKRQHNRSYIVERHSRSATCS